MPLVDVLVARREATIISSQLMDVRGKVRSATIPISPDATQLSIDLILDAIGNASNAAQLSRETTASSVVINPLNPLVEYYDESYSTTEQVAVFFFQNDLGEVRTLEVPAPDLDMFETTNREVINPSDDRSAAIITAVVGGLNAGDPAGTFAYNKGYLATRRSSRARVRAIPTAAQIVEPGVGDLPGAEPGL